MTMDRMEIRGRCGTAIAYAKVIEDEAVAQIRRMYGMILGDVIGSH